MSGAREASSALSAYLAVFEGNADFLWNAMTILCAATLCTRSHASPSDVDEERKLIPDAIAFPAFAYEKLS